MARIKTGKTMDKNINQQLSRTVAALSTNTPTKAGAKDSRPEVDKAAVMDVVDEGGRHNWRRQARKFGRDQTWKQSAQRMDE